MENRASATKALGVAFGLAVLSTGTSGTLALAVEPAPSPTVEPAPSLAVEASATRPNVLLLYLDDLADHPRRLWCDETLTPRLARFCEEGISFENAVGTTPVCGPSRATLLTGRYGHATGVTQNESAADAFDPTVTLATEMQAAGYHTLFAGKYINGISTSRKRDVRRYAAGWDEFDIIWRRTGDGESKHFYDYELWTRDGASAKGTRPRDHSTRVVTDRLARHIRRAPADQPILAVASLAQGHGPNIALPQHVDSPACADTPPWRGRSYDERNVSDKPRYVRRRPRLEKGGFDLRTRCEEMLSVDWALDRLTRALSEAGRLDDTLIIFTSDNGLLLGDYRSPSGKFWPYAAPVPLYMLWPDGTDGQRRVVAEPVSDVDLAPTLCDLAGCALPEADGLSLLPLIRGETDGLDRPFVYTENLHAQDDMPPWYGLYTTRAYSDSDFWVYTELETGERELYDLVADPQQLRNLARERAHAERLEELHTLLHEGVIEPDGVEFLDR